MFKHTLISASLAAFCAFTSVAWAVDSQQTQDKEVVYGSQLMTQQERIEFRDKLRAAKTQEERDQIRAEHHAKMQARAKEKGVTLPDAPPAGGMGGGMGPGRGMGPGPRQ